jgi:ketosteroid isomerase-like protein
MSMAAESDTQALAKRFFDAVERGDIDTLHACYAPEARIWHNTDALEQTRDENSETLRGFVRRIPSRTYAQRRLFVFDGGFVQQHALEGVRQDGVKVRLPACIVCQVEGGRITRLDEYFDSAHVVQFRAGA